MTIDVNPAATVPAPRTGTFIQALGYIGLEVADFDAWERFATDVLGLRMRLGPDGETRLLKMDGNPYRFILTHGPADDLVFAGWQVADSDTLDAYASYLDGLGVAFAWAEPALLAQRRVARMLRVRDPNGIWHEAYAGMPQGEPFERQVTRGGFVTGAGGLGHIVFGTPDYPGSVAFARRVLGAGISDIIEQQMTPTLTAHVTFLHVNERHHSIAYAGRPGGKKLHHFMIEVEQIADVGLARDRHLKTGLAIAQDIGQHPNDEMISYYGATPSGFFVEYGWGGVKVDVATWKAGAFDRLSDWGHRPLLPAVPALAHARPATMESKMSATGNWKLLITTPMGQQPAELTLAADLNGTMTAMGETANTYDAALDGSQLGFKADVTRPLAMTLTFSLVVDGDTLAGQVQAGAMGMSPVAGQKA